MAGGKNRELGKKASAENPGEKKPDSEAHTLKPGRSESPTPSGADDEQAAVEAHAIKHI